MPLIEKIMPISARPRRVPNPLVAALMYDDFCVFEFACVAEVFGLPRPEAGPNWYTFKTASLRGRNVVGQYGTRMAVDMDVHGLLDAGTVIVPGWRNPEERPPEALLQALRTAHARGARIVSICSGAFVLAEAGLLDGGRATTHWRYRGAFEQRYPGVTFEPNVLYVQEGTVITSAGSAAGIDMCLHLVRSDFGVRAANLVAKRLVVSPHREGGQSQFVVAPVDVRESGGFGRVLEKIRSRIDQPLTIETMARWASLSPRSFHRRFVGATGMSPGEWLSVERVNLAKILIEETTQDFETIAAKSGLGTATNLRHQFRRRLGLSPRSFRKAFGL
ncbi:transcriptional regulator FtrA [Silanimonas sp.]|jgi:AraC family transcriptional activator FtrA|uniref:transcriptional regulator FtrA n=1 Tax=Silanimonas sp. TaxID=1929290 RepID=UPI0031BB8EEA